MGSKQIVTINSIRKRIFDAPLDSEYGEALAHNMMYLGYVSDSPLSLYTGTEKQQQELERVETTPLNANQISELIHMMMYEMRNDFQYGRFKPIALEYLDIANKMREKEVRNSNANKKRPICNIKEAYGSMPEIIALASETLKQHNMHNESREMIERATMSYDYDDAYNVIKEYVEPVEERSIIQENEEEFE